MKRTTGPTEEELRQQLLDQWRQQVDESTARVKAGTGDKEDWRWATEGKRRLEEVESNVND